MLIMIVLSVITYVFGSTLMNTLMYAAVKEKSQELDSSAFLAIHVMSLLWPMTLILTLVTILYSTIKRLFIGSR